MGTNTSRRMGTLAGAMLVVGAGATGLLGAAPANAATDYSIFLAAGGVNDAPPVRVVGGLAIGLLADEAKTPQIALSNCVKAGGHQCVVVTSAKNGCAAVAANDFGDIRGSSDPSVYIAQKSALAHLQNNQGAHIVLSGCSNGQVSTPSPPPPPAPPAAPKPGPTVTFNAVAGGLEAHITDRSGVASQCTYVTDGVNRSFGLAANSTFDLRIVPAIPQFRNWNISVSCDNGTTTQTTTFF